MIREPISQTIIVLGVVLGGAALFLSQISPYLNLFLIIAIFGGVLGYLWPDKVWQCSFWLGFPLLALTILNFIQALNINSLVYGLLNFAEVLLLVYLSCLAGSRLSPRGLPSGRKR